MKSRALLRAVVAVIAVLMAATVPAMAQGLSGVRTFDPNAELTEPAYVANPDYDICDLATWGIFNYDPETGETWGCFSTESVNQTLPG